MRRICAWFGLTFLGVVVPALVAVAAFAPGVAEAAGCQPSVTSVTTQMHPYGGHGRVDIRGRCFGNSAAFSGDRGFLRISDLGSTGAQHLPNSNWNACWTGDPGTDAINCDVSEWSDTHVVFRGFTGAYGEGGYTVGPHDVLAFQVWNAQSGVGPAVGYFNASAPVAAHNPHLGALARALASPTHAFSNISSDVVNGTIAVAAVLFITFPANLFNQTFEENYADIRAWWRRRFGRLFRKSDEVAPTAEVASVKPGAFAAVVLGGAFLGGLLDPGFGFNLRSVLTVVALALAICAGIAVPLVATQAYYRARHMTASLHVRALPAGLAIAAACVLISRVSGFQPGYLYGVVAGVVLGRTLSKREQTHLIALTTLAVIGVSVLAWIAWAGVDGSAKAAHANDALVLIDDALAAMFVAGLVGSVISMLPLRFLPGHALKSASTRAWAAVFGVSLFGLIQVMLRPNATDQGPSHAPLVTTLLLFVAFAAGTAVFRWHFIRKQRRAAGEPDLTWQQALVLLAGEARNKPAQLSATTDGVSFIDVTEPVVEPVVDLTAAEAGADVAPVVPAQRAPRKRATPRAGAKSR
ncbi:MAG: hypothetical protein JO079_10155 [Frankiaceae bacterium]|nr:hypothetical protein [Frankiaceae bacterium]MBV9369612.1 hypothetical protein [Frankiales bacterium]